MITWKLTYTIYDAKKARGTLAIHLPGGLEWGAVELYAQAFAVKLDKLIEGRIAAISVGRAISLPDTLRAAPATAADVEQKLSLSFNATPKGAIRFQVATFRKDRCKRRGFFPFRRTWTLDHSLTEVTDWLNLHTAATEEEFAGNPCEARGGKAASLNSSELVFGKS